MWKKVVATCLITAMVMAFGYQPVSAASLATTPYKGKPVVQVNKGKPKFTKKQKKWKKVYVKYSNLDKYGRCGKVTAVITKKNLAKGKRGSIGMYKPSGWPDKIGNAKYSFIPGKYLWNRSHLLGWQLYGNSTNNKKNLITGTRQLNAGSVSMLTYENKVANYLKKHKKAHVVYRVTPHYKGKERIARGVQMEAWSVEDKGVNINYFNGASSAKNAPKPTTKPVVVKETGSIVFCLNVSTKKFHLQSCRYATGDNIEQTKLTANQLIKDGYSPCKVCHPEQK